MKKPEVALLAVLCVCLLASCGMQREFGEGMLVKRKHLKGWHMDLGHRPAVKPQERRAMAPAAEVAPPCYHVEEMNLVADAGMMTAAPAPEARSPSTLPVPLIPMARTVPAPPVPRFLDPFIPAQHAPQADPPAKRWSTPAILSTVFFGVSIFALATGSYALFLMLLLVALLFSVMGLIHASKTDVRGRGLALGVMLGSLVLCVLLLIAASAVGPFILFGA